MKLKVKIRIGYLFWCSFFLFFRVTSLIAQPIQIQSNVPSISVTKGPHKVLSALTSISNIDCVQPIEKPTTRGGEIINQLGWKVTSELAYGAFDFISFWESNLTNIFTSILRDRTFFLYIRCNQKVQN